MINYLANVKCPECDGKHFIFQDGLFSMTHRYKYTCPDTKGEAIVKGDACGTQQNPGADWIECEDMDR